MGFGDIKSFLGGFQLYRAELALSYIQGIPSHTLLNLKSLLWSGGHSRCQKHHEGGEHMTFPFSEEACIKSWPTTHSSRLVEFLSFFTSHSETNRIFHFTNSMLISLCILADGLKIMSKNLEFQNKKEAHNSYSELFSSATSASCKKRRHKCFWPFL